MTEEDIVDRYRQLRALSKEHHSAAIRFVSGDCILENARRLGLARGKTLQLGSEEEFTLVLDLALHTAKPGRSRPLDRYARDARLAPDSDAARLLDAMRRARFSLWRVQDRHPSTGLVVSDLLRRETAWLVDGNFTASAAPDLTFAARLFGPDPFVMTSGVIIPVDRDLLEDVQFAMAGWGHAPPDVLAQDPRLAAAVYRSAIDLGVMEGVVYA